MADSEQPKLHPVVELIVTRMESHPEEFRNISSGRWAHIVKSIETRAVGADKEAFEAARSKLWLDALHKQALDELINGEERRRRELEAQLDLQKQTYAAHQRAYTQASGISLGSLTGGTVSGYANTTSDIQNLLASASHNSFVALPDTVDALTSNPNMLDKLKKALGI